MAQNADYREMTNAQQKILNILDDGKIHQFEAGLEPVADLYRAGFIEISSGNQGYQLTPKGAKLLDDQHPERRLGKLWSVPHLYGTAPTIPSKDSDAWLL